MYIIQIENVVKEYELSAGGRVKALDCINLNVRKGEILGVIGKSGAGKTTLLKIVRGVERFDQGTVTVEGIKLTPSSSPEEFYKVKCKTAIHLQRSFGLWSETVLDNVIRALYFHDNGEEMVPSKESSEYEEYSKKALETLSAVDLAHKAEFWVGILSGGEKQRLVLARQIAKKPSILLLDEPGTMTCPKSRDDLLNEVKNVNEKLGVTVVVVSHMPEVHMHICDRVVRIEQGKVVEEGDPREITRKFVSEMEPIEPKIPLHVKKAAISMKNVTKGYYSVPGGRISVMKDLSLDTYSGEILAIIGPSGAGKTVLLRLISGCEIPDKGEIIFNTEDGPVNMAKLGLPSTKLRLKLAMLHQEFDLPFSATVAEIFARRLGLRVWPYVENAMRRAKKMGIGDEIFDFLYRVTDLPRKEAVEMVRKLGLEEDVLDYLFPTYPLSKIEKKAVPVLEFLGLPRDILYRRIYELSKGEQVRIAIGAAFLSKPSVSLLDEPFGDLDPITLRKIANVIKEVNKKFKSTFILVSHQLDFIKEVVHRAALITNGELISSGNPKKVCERFLRLIEEGKISF